MEEPDTLSVTSHGSGQAMPKFTERKLESGGMWLSELLFPVIILQQQLSLLQAENEVFPYCEGTEIEGLNVPEWEVIQGHQRFSMWPQEQKCLHTNLHQSSPSVKKRLNPTVSIPTSSWPLTGSPDSVLHTGEPAFLTFGHLENPKAWGLCIQNGCHAGHSVHRTTGQLCRDSRDPSVSREP